MKKIIDGKLFNTETAERICSTGFSSPGDFSYWKDTLYKTKKGTYFIHGKGGPRSHYAVNIGNNTISGSEEMWTVGEDVAKKFCEENDVSKAEELFGEEIEEG